MSVENLKNSDVALIGIMSDSNSSYKRGAAEAPVFIRRALHSGSSNLCSETGVDLAGNARFVDVGDRQVKDDPESFLAIEAEIGQLTARGALPLASPFARTMEDGLASRLVQVGIRTLSQHLRSQAERFGVEIHEMRNLDTRSIGLDFEGPVYISCDIDALDPAYAPAVSHLEPGGLSVRDILGIIQRLPNRIVGADIVEYNPGRDINDMTAMVAAKLLKEIAGRMLLNVTV